MRPLTIKMPKPLEERLDQLARRRGVSRSALVREALEAYVARPGASALDLAGDLVGSLDGLPADLSTNPKHLYENLGESRPARRRSHRRAPESA
jgi:hypothetical protein